MEKECRREFLFDNLKRYDFTQEGMKPSMHGLYYSVVEIAPALIDVSLAEHLLRQLSDATNIFMDGGVAPVRQLLDKIAIYLAVGGHVSQVASVRNDSRFLEMVHNLDTAQLGSQYGAAVDELIDYVDARYGRRLFAPPDAGPAQQPAEVAAVSTIPTTSNDTEVGGRPSYLGYNFCPHCGNRLASGPEQLHQYEGFTYCNVCDPD